MVTEHDHLAEAARHIARSLIERMSERGPDTTLAENLLHIMQNTLERMYEHRAMIEAAIAGGQQ
jgi:hypothetical protein